MKSPQVQKHLNSLERKEVMSKLFDQCQNAGVAEEELQELTTIGESEGWKNMRNSLWSSLINFFQTTKLNQDMKQITF